MSGDDFGDETPHESEEYGDGTPLWEKFIVGLQMALGAVGIWLAFNGAKRAYYLWEAVA